MVIQIRRRGVKEKEKRRGNSEGVKVVYLSSDYIQFFLVTSIKWVERSYRIVINVKP